MTAEGAEQVFRVGKKVWLPNTTVKVSPYASAVLLQKDRIYFATTGGLGGGRTVELTPRGVFLYG